MDKYKEIGDSGPEIRVYRKRWAILLLFSTYSGSNCFQWIEFGIISNIISRFYGVPLTSVNWLSIIYMLVYIPLVFPATYLLDRYGLRFVALWGSGLNALGSFIKVFSADPNLFALTMLGQTICSVAQMFILGMPAKVAATWFSSDEVSTATSIGVFGSQLGVGIGFLIPPLIVPDVEDIEVIQQSLFYLYIGTSAFTFILFVIVVAIFNEKPQKPPSLAQKLFLESKKEDDAYLDSIKYLMTCSASMFLILSYGISTGAFYAISTLLNQEILEYHSDSVVQAGQIGLTMILSGIVGAIIGGIVLDKTKAFRTTTTVTYVAVLLSMILYTVTLSLDIWVVFLSIAILGFFMTGYLPIGFEYAAEITYPVSEGSSSGMLNMSAQAFGIVFTVAMARLIPEAGVLGANIFLVAMIFSGLILTLLIKSELKRHNANKEEAIKESMKVSDLSVIASSQLDLVPAEFDILSENSETNLSDLEKLKNYPHGTKL